MKPSVQALNDHRRSRRLRCHDPRCPCCDDWTIHEKAASLVEWASGASFQVEKSDLQIFCIEIQIPALDVILAEVAGCG